MARGVWGVRAIYRGNMDLSWMVSSNLLNTIAIVVILLLMRLITIRLINHQVKSIQARHTWRKMSAYIIVLIGIVFLGRLWLTGMESLFTYLGLLSAGLAIALQGPLTNLFGWLFIIIRRPFEVGDRVQIEGDAGDVIDIRIFEFTLLEIGNWVEADQSTGRVLHIPNGKVFKEALANYNKGFEYIWHEISVTITFESNWEKAKGILQDIVQQNAAHLSTDAPDRIKRASQRYPIMYTHITPIVYTQVAASGVLFTIRYLCEPRQRRASEEAIWEDVLRRFAPHPDIEFAYPTQRFYQVDNTK